MATEATKEGLRRLVHRPAMASAALLAVYAVLALFNADGGYLGTDTGAKVYTLEQMDRNDSWRPSIGYWAEEWDPEGLYHPLYDSVLNDEGEWTNVTTLPMLLAARPLYEIGGYRLALLLPMLGAVTAALACRDLARLLGGDDRAGWAAFWIVGLASPMAVYALDLWEHSLGAGLMVGALVLLLRSGGSDRAEERLGLAAMAGLCLGVSATMRTESFVVAIAFVGGVCLQVLLRRALARAIAIGAATMLGFGVPWLANDRLEAALGGASRASRVAGVSQRHWWSELSERSDEAWITWFRLPNLEAPGDVLLGVIAIGVLIGAVVASRAENSRLPRLLLMTAAVCYLPALAQRPNFVSGALVACPVAAAAFVDGARVESRRAVLAMAVVATVVTWAFQHTGGALPQWGGRYLLAPTLVLTVIGVVHLSGSHDVVLGGIAAISLMVTAFGLVWVHERTNGIEDFFEMVAARARVGDDVVIAPNAFFVREAGYAIDNARYLSVGRGGTLAGAIEVAADSGAHAVAVLTTESVPTGLDARFVETTTFDLVGIPFNYHRFEFDS